jgi:hypothetical protein
VTAELEGTASRRCSRRGDARAKKRALRVKLNYSSESGTACRHGNQDHRELIRFETGRQLTLSRT